MAGADVLLLLTGAGLGFANTLASSGSALSLPMLIGLGLAPEIANGTNRVAVLAAALAAVASFARAGHIRWRIVAPLMASASVGAVLGAWISELVSPTRLHLAIVAALCIALALMAIRPSRWLDAAAADPRVGSVQLLLVFVVGIWTGFIVLDGATYLLIVLVLSVGLDVVGANAAKSAIIAAVAAVSLPVLAAGGSIEWRAAGVLSAGAVAGGLLAARAALLPGASRWIYRLIVVIIAGELAQLVWAGTRMM